MIRQELYHPLISHFPIVIIILALVSKILEITFKEKREFSFLTKGLLYTAPLFMIFSIYTGDTAFDIVKSELCELALVYSHEESGKITLILLMITIFLEVLTEIKQFAKFSFIRYLALLSLFVTVLSVAKTAHLGAELVYDHGAAVKLSKKECFSRDQ